MHPVTPLADNCPWAGHALPNIKWCEANLCSWVTTPANSYSNVVFLLFGAWMAFDARGDARPGLRWFGPVSIILGLASFAYHASYTFFFQVFDFAGMFLYLLLPLALNLGRLGLMDARWQRRVVIGGTLLLTALVFPLTYWHVPIQGMVVVLVLVLVGQEVRIARRVRDGASYRWFFAALVAIAAAATFSVLDVTGVFCDPDNHLVQGHAIWHVLSAAALYLLFRFYRALPARA